MTKRTVKSEFKAGYESGQLHEWSDSLCNENLRKMFAPATGYYPLIEAYWEGHRLAIAERLTVPEAMDTVRTLRRQWASRRPAANRDDLWAINRLLTFLGQIELNQTGKIAEVL